MHSRRYYTTRYWVRVVFYSLVLLGVLALIAVIPAFIYSHTNL